MHTRRYRWATATDGWSRCDPMPTSTSRHRHEALAAPLQRAGSNRCLHDRPWCSSGRRSSRRCRRHARASTRRAGRADNIARETCTTSPTCAAHCAAPARMAKRRAQGGPRDHAGIDQAGHDVDSALENHPWPRSWQRPVAAVQGSRRRSPEMMRNIGMAVELQITEEQFAPSIERNSVPRLGRDHERAQACGGVHRRVYDRCATAARSSCGSLRRQGRAHTIAEQGWPDADRVHARAGEYRLSSRSGTARRSWRDCRRVTIADDHPCSSRVFPLGLPRSALRCWEQRGMPTAHEDGGGTTRRMSPRRRQHAPDSTMRGCRARRHWPLTSPRWGSRHLCISRGIWRPDCCGAARAGWGIC